MIAASPKVAYIHEPFNINHDIGICKARFDHWFTYICEQNEHQYYEHIKNTTEFRYNLLGKLQLCRKPRHLARAIRSYARVSGYRVSNVRPLLKDPIAVFSADWLSSNFNMDTVVMIRHPAAFAGSLKVNNWTHPFSHFLEQPLLMKEHLYPFEGEIRYFAEKERDVVDQAALLWKLVHYMILKFRKTNPDWSYIRHEDLSLDPLNGFKSLFSKIGLEFSEHVSKVVERHSSHGTSTISKPGYYFEKLQRDSISNISNWQNRLTPSEVKRIRFQVNEISEEFYSEEEW